jgi:predicted nucleic acid-binding protein
MSIVADTSSLNYAVLIGESETLHRLYGRVVIPEAVFRELKSLQAPEPVRTWIASPPEWLDVQSTPAASDAALTSLGPGEREAIALAEQLGVTLLMDESDGRREARRRSVPVTGLLGALRDAGDRGLTDFPQALARLRKTTFRLSPKLFQSLMGQVMGKATPKRPGS